MRYFLENEILKAEIDSKGAELKSVLRKSDYREYMWYSSPRIWNRTSPILFPVVGGLTGKRFVIDGQEYPMGQHGFARDMEFSPESKREVPEGSGCNEELWFILESNEETLKKYPFAFRLHLGYRLDGDKLAVMWRVENPADDTMYFSIGAHPAFLCPVHGENSKTGYRLFFEGCEQIRHYGNPDKSGLASPDEDLVLDLSDERAVITEDFFDRCTYIITGGQTKKVGIEDPEGKRIVTVSFDMPLFAIWSPEKKNAPFICIEPWFGRCDAAGYTGEFKDREYTQTLAGKETFETQYTVQFHEV